MATVRFQRLHIRSPNGWLLLPVCLRVANTTEFAAQTTALPETGAMRPWEEAQQGQGFLA